MLLRLKLNKLVKKFKKGGKMHKTKNKKATDSIRVIFYAISLTFIFTGILLCIAGLANLVIQFN